MEILRRERFKVAYVFLILLLLVIAQSARAWEVDFSRRQKRTTQSSDSPKVLTDSQPGEITPAKDKAEIERLVSRRAARTNVDRQEIVILNTEKGFVPANIRVHKGAHYLVHVVNVNEDKKNISFMLDAFKQNHATYFGKIKSFPFDPDQEGVFEFQCPETSSAGKFVVLSPSSMPPVNRSITSDR